MKNKKRINKEKGNIAQEHKVIMSTHNYTGNLNNVIVCQQKDGNNIQGECPTFVFVLSFESTEGLLSGVSTNQRSNYWKKLVALKPR